MEETMKLRILRHGVMVPTQACTIEGCPPIGKGN